MLQKREEAPTCGSNEEEKKYYDHQHNTFDVQLFIWCPNDLILYIQQDAFYKV
jgi:hypothetical protein